MSKPKQLPFFQECPVLSLTHRALLGHLRFTQLKLQCFIQMARVSVFLAQPSSSFPCEVPSLLQEHFLVGHPAPTELCASCRGPKLSENSISKDDAFGSYS